MLDFARTMNETPIDINVVIHTVDRHGELIPDVDRKENMKH